MLRGIPQLKGEKTCRLFTTKGDCTDDQAFPIFVRKQLNKSSCFGSKKNMIIIQLSLNENRGNGRESPESILLICGKLREEVVLL